MKTERKCILNIENFRCLKLPFTKIPSFLRDINYQSANVLQIAVCCLHRNRFAFLKLVSAVSDGPFRLF